MTTGRINQVTIVNQHVPRRTCVPGRGVLTLAKLGRSDRVPFSNGFYTFPKECAMDTSPSSLEILVTRTVPCYRLPSLGLSQRLLVRKLNQLQELVFSTRDPWVQVTRSRPFSINASRHRNGILAMSLCSIVSQGLSHTHPLILHQSCTSQLSPGWDCEQSNNVVLGYDQPRLIQRPEHTMQTEVWNGRTTNSKSRTLC